MRNKKVFKNIYSQRAKVKVKERPDTRQSEPLLPYQRESLGQNKVTTNGLSELLTSPSHSSRVYLHKQIITSIISMED